MANEPQSRLLGLAAEMRNRIHDMVFEDYEVDWDDDKYRGPALLLACKQIHAEASGAYYSLSTFKSLSQWFVRRKLVKLAPTYRRLINSVLLDNALPHSRYRYYDYEKAAVHAQKQVLLLRDFAQATGCTGLQLEGAVKTVAWIYKARSDGTQKEAVKTDDPWQAFVSQSNDQSSKPRDSVSFMHLN